MRETYNLEFKQTMTNSFLKTVVAFANYDGGKIIFGLDDEANIIGIENPTKFAIDLENKINDSINPQVSYEIEIDQNYLVILNVESGDDKPYFYKSKSYKRNDSATVEVDNQELKRLILEGKNISYDQVPSTYKDYKFSYLEGKLQEQLGIDKLNNDILKTLELIDKNNELTNAGDIFSDRNSRNMIDIVRFGDDINTILSRFTYKDMSILKAFDLALDKYKEYYNIEKIDGMYRRKIELIPEPAFREAIANALVHRDWMIHSFIQISLTEEGIRIISPGSLTQGISEEEYINGNLSLMRNPIIANIFFRLDIIEAFGTGIRRIKKAYEDEVVKPEFKVYQNSIEVFLPVIEKSLDLSIDENKVIEALINKKLSSSQLGEITGFKKNKLIDLLNSLIEKSVVVREGKNRGTKYKLR
ncbi:RNA-binding domain-containing protein [uncultured Anaerococcus sp.]|uniref:RNA-binding domain-containing protein n=1 Tax=uncultured Anaerococcus sp. TaxID=293428 RepID=UPI002889D613|nr:RNA-binding domain-containing protein [uncultured Anaerococcus sp.]